MEKWPAPQFAIGDVIKVHVHEKVMPNESHSRDEWKACRRRWRDSGKTDCSIWGKYSELVASGRYHYANYDHRGAVGWPEGLLALSLMDDRFSCWTGVQLFRNREIDKQKRANTEEVDKHFKSLALKQPRTVQQYLSETKTGKTLLPKNPDLALPDSFPGIPGNPGEAGLNHHRKNHPPDDPFYPPALAAPGSPDSAGPDLQESRPPKEKTEPCMTT